MATSLPIVKVPEEDDKLFFFDERLRELRAINNPADRIELNDFEIAYYKNVSKNQLNGVRRILINNDEIRLITPNEEKAFFPRENYRLIVDDIEQAQDEAIYGKSRVLLMTDFIGCEIDEGKKIIFCGKNPKKVVIM